MTNRHCDTPPPKRGYVVRDGNGPVRCLAVSDGYVMCRRKGAAPFLLSVREWAALARAEKETRP